MILDVYDLIKFFQQRIPRRRGRSQLADHPVGGCYAHEYACMGIGFILFYAEKFKMNEEVDSRLLSEKVSNFHPCIIFDYMSVAPSYIEMLY